jgi:hypothetical protein
MGVTLVPPTVANAVFAATGARPAAPDRFEGASQRGCRVPINKPSFGG